MDKWISSNCRPDDAYMRQCIGSLHVQTMACCLFGASGLPESSGFKSILVQAMVWCCQATNHYQSQCLRKSMSQLIHNDYMSPGSQGANSCEIRIKIYFFSFKQLYFKMSSTKHWPFCPSCSVLIDQKQNQATQIRDLQNVIYDLPQCVFCFGVVLLSVLIDSCEAFPDFLFIHSVNWGHLSHMNLFRDLSNGSQKDNYILGHFCCHKLCDSYPNF